MPMLEGKVVKVDNEPNQTEFCPTCNNAMDSCCMEWIQGQKQGVTIPEDVLHTLKMALEYYASGAAMTSTRTAKVDHAYKWLESQPVGEAKAESLTDNDQPLQVVIVSGVLSISIGIERLAFCADGRQDKYKVSDAKQFAYGVRAAMLDDDEQGNTLVYDMIDSAIDKSVDEGNTGINVISPPRREK
jgi:hypothetical protein